MIVSDKSLFRLAQVGIETLADEDPHLFGLLTREYLRQANVLSMVAASSVVDPSVLACEAMVPVNVTAEGYPGARFHAGCSVIDQIEQLTIDRAKTAFGARFANVQPHSATTANQVVMCSVLRPGDTLMGLELSSGGHLTHGSKASMSGQYFSAVGYGLTPDGAIDYTQVEALAREHRPKLIICGTTAYPRVFDFARFRRIADDVGALLLADITHVAGLVVAGLHPNPIDEAHFTTTCTHKQLYGPRGGLILIGRDADRVSPSGDRTLAELVQKGVFPFFQGAPKLNSIAAKAGALGLVLKPEFNVLMQRIVSTARALAEAFGTRGYRVMTGGTDNHLVVLDVMAKGITGIIAEKALEECHITVNKNRIAGDQKPPTITSGIRIGTNTLALRQMEAADMPRCADLVHTVLSAVSPLSDREYELPDSVRREVIGQVRELCRRFPVSRYPLTDEDRDTAFEMAPHRSAAP